MELLRKWTRISLIKRILVGMLLGIILGMALPKFTVIGILGTLFVGALKALAPLLVFFIVILMLAAAMFRAMMMTTAARFFSVVSFMMIAASVFMFMRS